MTLGPFVPSQLTLAYVTGVEPGYYMSPAGIVLAVAHNSRTMLVALEGMNPYQEDQSLGNLPLVRIPVGSVEVAIEELERYGGAWRQGQLAVTGDGCVCLTVLARSQHGEELVHAAVDVVTCRAVAPNAFAEQWLWVPKWSLWSADARGSAYSFAESQSAPATNINMAWVG